MASSHQELSPRELQVVEGIVRGLTYSQIAVEIGVGKEAVKTYAARVRSKFGLNSKVQIAVWAVENEVVTDARTDPDQRQ